MTIPARRSYHVPTSFCNPLNLPDDMKMDLPQSFAEKFRKEPQSLFFTLRFFAIIFVFSAVKMDI